MRTEARHSNLAPACLLACLLGTGCDRPQPLGELAFPGSSLSVEALARDALRGLAASDAMLLNRLRLTETEHNEVVWPELPASAPEIGFPVDFAWRNIQLRNESALERVAGWYRSNPVRYQVAECRGETRAFTTFRVHTDCWVLFLTGRGEPLEVQLFKDVLERDGGYKIFRYYDELPRRARRAGDEPGNREGSGDAPPGASIVPVPPSAHLAMFPPAHPRHLEDCGHLKIWSTTT